MKCTVPLLLMLAATSALGATEPLSMQVSPQAALAPVDLQVLVRLVPNLDNRSLAIVADSPDFYRRSEIPLEGHKAPRTVQLAFRAVPPGEYEVSAALVDNRGDSRAVVQRRVLVL